MLHQVSDYRRVNKYHSSVHTFLKCMNKYRKPDTFKNVQNVTRGSIVHLQ